LTASVSPEAWITGSSERVVIALQWRQRFAVLDCTRFISFRLELKKPETYQKIS
jgi:hypothetical protein